MSAAKTSEPPQQRKDQTPAESAADQEGEEEEEEDKWLIDDGPPIEMVVEYPEDDGGSREWWEELLAGGYRPPDQAGISPDPGGGGGPPDQDSQESGVKIPCFQFVEGGPCVTRGFLENYGDLEIVVEWSPEEAPVPTQRPSEIPPAAPFPQGVGITYIKEPCLSKQVPLGWVTPPKVEASEGYVAHDSDLRGYHALTGVNCGLPLGAAPTGYTADLGPPHGSGPIYKVTCPNGVVWYLVVTTTMVNGQVKCDTRWFLFISNCVPLWSTDLKSPQPCWGPGMMEDL